MSRVPLESSRRAVSKSVVGCRSKSYSRGSRKAMFRGEPWRRLRDSASHQPAHCRRSASRSRSLALLVRAWNPVAIGTRADPEHPRAAMPSLIHPSRPPTRNMLAPTAGVASPAIGCRTSNEAPPGSFPHQPPRAQHGARCLFSHVQPIFALARSNTRLHSLHVRRKIGLTTSPVYMPFSICRNRPAG